MKTSLAGNSPPQPSATAVYPPATAVYPLVRVAPSATVRSTLGAMMLFEHGLCHYADIYPVFRSCQHNPWLLRLCTPPRSTRLTNYAVEHGLVTVRLAPFVRHCHLYVGPRAAITTPEAIPVETRRLICVMYSYGDGYVNRISVLLPHRSRIFISIDVNNASAF